MARPLAGAVLSRRLHDGRLSFHVKIRDQRVKLGEEPDWDLPRAERLLSDVLVPAAKLQLPWWERVPGQQPQSVAGGGRVPDFHEVASEYLHALGRFENANSRNAYASPVVKHLLPFFAYEDAARTRPRRMDAITGPLVTEFTIAKQAERAVLRELPDVLAELDPEVLCDQAKLAEQLDPREWELVRRYGLQGGRYSLRDPEARGRIAVSTRGLSNNEINRCLTRLRSLFEFVNDTYDLALRDPTRRRMLPRTDPPREWLRPDQFQAMLDAASELDADPARQRYATHGRYSAIVMLGLAGPRVSELCAARWQDFHPSEGVLRIVHSKTSAGERDIELHQLVLRVLSDRYERSSPEPGDFIWPSATGTRRDRSSVRNRLLAAVIGRADELLAERGQRRLPRAPGLPADQSVTAPPRVTPHTFRRTYLTYLAWAGRPERFAMGQAGHKDAKLTLEVYQQPLPSKFDERVRQWLA